MATTASIGTLIGSKVNDITIPVTIESDGDGGALAATSVFRADASHMKLDEVEIVAGSGTGHTISIKSSRGAAPATLFSQAIEAGCKVYGGHQTNGFFPKMDNPWTIETDAFSASDTALIYLKFSRANA